MRERRHSRREHKKVGIYFVQVNISKKSIDEYLVEVTLFVQIYQTEIGNFSSFSLHSGSE